MRACENPILKQKLNSAERILDRGTVYFTEYDPHSKSKDNCFSVYLATNENCAYFPKMTSFEDKDVLSVTGSGDQALNAVFFGAKSVETFDINQLAFLFYELKEAALLHLTREEFLDFYNDINLFPRQLYDKISRYLKSETKTFFNGLFAHVDLQVKKKVDGRYSKMIYRTKMLGRLVTEPGDVETNLVSNNPYLASEQTFKEMKSRLKLLKQPIGCKFCPAHKIGGMFKSKDVVIMSNILSYYMDDSYEGKHKFREKAFVKSLARTMKEDGVVSLLYEYSHNLPMDGVVENSMHIKTTVVPVIEDDFDGDRVLVTSKPELMKSRTFRTAEKTM